MFIINSLNMFRASLCPSSGEQRRWLRYFYNNLKTPSSNTYLIDAKILSFYTRYVEDILLIYDSTRTNPDNILQYVYTIHSNIQLSPTMEATIYPKPSYYD